MGCGVGLGGVGTAEPLSAEAFAALRAHPGFRGAVEALARGNLANYGGATLAERWLTSDLGRASLTGAAMVLDAMLDGFAAPHLIDSARANRTCSEGRVRLYLRRAAANGFLDADAGGRLRVSEAMQAVLARGVATMLGAVARLDPGAAEAAAAVGDPGFRRRFATHLGLNTVARPDLFRGPEMPVELFLGRDGGARMLEQLIVAQPPDRSRLLETARASQRALAQGAFVSRTHAARLLAEGEARGLLRAEGRRVSVAPELSDDVERHYALVLEMARASARAALASAG